MASYKLTYFDARGRGEGIRYIFAQAGVKYEDNRIKREDWPKLKETTPFGQLPILEVDGKVLSGSGSICRLLAEKFGLAGLNEFENAELDSIADFINDFALTQITKFWGEKDEARKAELKKEIIEKQIPRYFGTLEKRIVANNSPDGWIFRTKVTYIDFSLALTTEVVKMMLGENVLDDYAAIKKLTDSVNALPNIAKWINERPQTQF